MSVIPFEPRKVATSVEDEKLAILVSTTNSICLRSLDRILTLSKKNAIYSYSATTGVYLAERVLIACREVDKVLNPISEIKPIDFMFWPNYR